MIDSTGSVIGHGLTDFDGIFTITLADRNYIGKTVTISAIYLNFNAAKSLTIVDGRNSIQIKIKALDAEKGYFGRVIRGGYNRLVVFQAMDKKRLNPACTERPQNPILEAPILRREKSFWQGLRIWKK